MEGGKWTTSRGLAEAVLDRLGKKTNLAVKSSRSQKRYLEGSEIDDMDRFLSHMKGENHPFQPKTLEYVGRLYGTAYDKVLALCEDEPALRQSLNTEGDILAQVLYAVRHEMARTLQDVLLRRTGIATLGNPGKEVLLRVARVMAEALNWDDRKMNMEVEKATAFLEIPFH